MRRCAALRRASERARGSRASGQPGRGVQYSMVVYLDSDFLVVRSIDDLFDRQIRSAVQPPGDGRCVARPRETWTPPPRRAAQRHAAHAPLGVGAGGRGRRRRELCPFRSAARRRRMLRAVRCALAGRTAWRVARPYPLAAAPEIYPPTKFNSGLLVLHPDADVFACVRCSANARTRACVHARSHARTLGARTHARALTHTRARTRAHLHAFARICIRAHAHTSARARATAQAHDGEHGQVPVVRRRRPGLPQLVLPWMVRRNNPRSVQHPPRAHLQRTRMAAHARMLVSLLRASERGCADTHLWDSKSSPLSPQP
jgi:hypothetical protein